MELVNFLLNLLCWFLWAGAFVFPRYAVRSSQPLTLLSTLRSEPPRSFSRIFFLGSLVLLLGLRGAAYWNFSPSNASLPAIDVGLLKVSLQPDSLSQMACYSFGSFAVFLYGYYLWVFGLSLTSRLKGRVDSIENLIDQQLGAFAMWHPGLKVALVGLVGGLLWVGLGFVLISLGALAENWNGWVLVAQSPVGAAAFWLRCLILVMLIIGVHFINSYVYLGEKPLWAYVDQTAKTYLTPFRKLPLLVVRFDVAPLLGGLAYWGLFCLGDWGLRLVFERLSG